jgi:hypothetical protein
LPNGYTCFWREIERSRGNLEGNFSKLYFLQLDNTFLIVKKLQKHPLTKENGRRSFKRKYDEASVSKSKGNHGTKPKHYTATTRSARQRTRERKHFTGQNPTDFEG